MKTIDITEALAQKVIDTIYGEQEARDEN